MTQVMQRLIDRLERLPAAMQDRYAHRFLGELEAEIGRTDPQENLPEAQTPYDRIRHLSGILEGPGDLSTNPKYMEGFGESSMR